MRAGMMAIGRRAAGVKLMTALKLPDVAMASRHLAMPMKHGDAAQIGVRPRRCVLASRDEALAM